MTLSSRIAGVAFLGVAAATLLGVRPTADYLSRGYAERQEQRLLAAENAIRSAPLDTIIPVSGDYLLSCLRNQRLPAVFNNPRIRTFYVDYARGLDFNQRRLYIDSTRTKYILPIDDHGHLREFKVVVPDVANKGNVFCTHRLTEIESFEHSVQERLLRKFP
jgi:hypothetical protein